MPVRHRAGLGTAGERLEGELAHGGEHAEPRLAALRRYVAHEGTGQALYPAIEFENGTWYREESKDMEATIRAGKLMEKAGSQGVA